MIQNQQYEVPPPRGKQRSQQQQQYPPHRQWGRYDQRQNAGQGRRQPLYGQGRNLGQRPPWRRPGVRPARLKAEEDEYEDEYWGDGDEERERDADLRDDARRHGESPVRATGEREDDAWGPNVLHCNRMHSFPQRLLESRNGEAHETDYLRLTAAPLQREALRERERCTLIDVLTH
uniref:Uncharacterized protein n=1 Tax=Chromera velia CCMP2878 TaxID=1169474 RepID=A0A0G4HN32_9ALVE|eukprot:Cvel_1175.t1-p1 / transcript=Cvel_1175.t1 / gene=Cvel_1175 / organism=Chromera_velia_CCMP2878 / gene_product=hypothetical protein / transcript_product=hypothetical protein / location=Cvel_scaffold39:53238-53762(-) / protein_length=175 / sequence_SO=supercontig / SO=protein_coding / is_pseudo=false